MDGIGVGQRHTQDEDEESRQGLYNGGLFLWHPI